MIINLWDIDIHYENEEELRCLNTHSIDIQNENTRNRCSLHNVMVSRLESHKYIFCIDQNYYYYYNYRCKNCNAKITLRMTGLYGFQHYSSTCNEIILRQIML